MEKIFPLFLAIFLCGCSVETALSSSSSSQNSSSLQTSVSSSLAENFEQKEDDITYIKKLTKDTIKKIITANMSDTEKVQTAYEYIVANTFFADPIGLDIWRIRGKNQSPTYLENRALSVLAFGIGSCEDYAAALVLLLEEMGFEARYIPGLTISIGGDYVDHAWTAVKLNGAWYHLDPQLEDNVTKNDMLNYRYFLKTDREISTNHLWGEYLIKYANLTDKQIAEIRDNYNLPPCDRQFAVPSSKRLVQSPVPDINKITNALKEEIRIYEHEHGKLEPVEFDITPPVFGNEGYGPPD